MIPIMLDWRNHFEGGDKISLGRGHVVFQRDDKVTSAYLVLSGAVALARVLPNGDSLVLNTARAGDLLAEASVFAPAYHCYAIVQEAAEVLVLRRSVLSDRLQGDPHSLFGLLGDTAREIQRLRSQIEILRLKRVSERLDAWLVFNAAPDTGKWVDVANAIGVSPAALYRELAVRKVRPIQHEGSVCRLLF